MLRSKGSRRWLGFFSFFRCFPQKQHQKSSNKIQNALFETMTRISVRRPENLARKSDSPIYEIFDVTFSRFSGFSSKKSWPEMQKKSSKRLQTCPKWHQGPKARSVYEGKVLKINHFLNCVIIQQLHVALFEVCQFGCD